jgi:glycosyltransferase involved in cell wall biosynthesis
MACGTPVIAFDRGSVPEIVEDGLTGFIVERKEEAVAAADQLSRLARGAIRRRFEERFTARRMAHEYLAVYRGLIDKRHIDSCLDGVHTTLVNPAPTIAGNFC